MGHGRDRFGGHNAAPRTVPSCKRRTQAAPLPSRARLLPELARPIMTVPRAANDRLGVLTLGEAVLVEGEAAQTNTLRW